ncbi:hemolysin family protein [Arenicella xantha]|uniref:Magnesium and cobalt efflux protein CorC n=1 Tax=Arenicella xantha TaxID=644221 RepID=A0A395JJI1_9GAMM|nr:hemolysin family protein [Arenicella xantha]RBP50669.1 CBS domain containing-hemolysin-like protein [Arenicella xantha]
MSSETIGILTILVLLAINAFFVAAEFALVKARAFRIDQMADSGSRAAKLTQRIQQKLESYLAACQLGITMASLGLGWVGEPVVAALLEPMFHALGMSGNTVHTTSFILGFLIFSSLHIIIGEQVPKTFAIRKSEPVSLWSAYPLHWFYLCAFPLNWLLNKASGSILSLFNVEEATHADVLSNAEIQGIIDTSEQHGELDTDRATMLQNMFKFDSHSVQQIMVPKPQVEILNLNDSWEDALRVMQSSGHSRFPVFDGNTDNPIGVVLVKDIYSAIVSSMGGVTVNGGSDRAQAPDPLGVIRQCLRTPLLVPERQQVSNLFELMRKDRVHLAVVMDEYGSFSGVVTMEDMLEEIVGEISDELDIDDPHAAVIWVEDHWQTDGMVSLNDLSRAIDVDFPNFPDANTINGLFMKQLDRMPKQNDQIEYYDLRFIAVTEERNRIGKVTIFPVNSSMSASELSSNTGSKYIGTKDTD